MTHQVLFADLVPKARLRSYGSRRGELVNPKLVKNVFGVAAAVTRLREAGYARDYLIIDTPGPPISPLFAMLLAAADVVLLPVQASALDVHGQDAAFDLVETAGMHRSAP